MRSRLASFCTGRTFPNLVILTLLLYISLFRRTDDAPPVLIPQPPAPAPGIVMTGSSFPKAATGPYVEPQATVHELDTLAARYAVNASDGVPLRLGLQSPMYNVRVLRTILTHQNNTWQDMPGEARGYFVQSLLWMQPVSTHSLMAFAPGRKERYANHSILQHRLTPQDPTTRRGRST